MLSALINMAVRQRNFKLIYENVSAILVYNVILGFSVVIKIIGHKSN